jgi:DNA polymerase-3 subunit alpha
MKAADFTHLHVHTTRSLLDGFTRVEDLVGRVKEFGQPAVAITDHGNLGNIPSLWREAKKTGVKPIAGLEAYVCEDRTVRGGGKGTKTPYFHLTLLAQNAEGYGNLCRLSSISYIEGFYTKPRIDLSALAEHSAGLIVLSGCLGGVPQQLILGDKEREALDWCAKVRDMMDGRFFLESQMTGEADQEIVNTTFLSWTKRHGFRHVVTGDSHYTKKEDHLDHDVLLCIGIGRTVADETRLKFVPEQYAVRSTAEMEALGFPAQSLLNTRLVAEMCASYELPRAGGFPQREHAYEVLEAAAMDGLSRRLTHVEQLCRHCGAENDHSELDCPQGAPMLPALLQPLPGSLEPIVDSDPYWARLMQELETIRKLKFEDYFLIAHDIVSYARDHHMWWSWGRGSSVGSLVAYALGITGIDPVRFHLYFERFLNESRRNPPDIDIDFTDEDRPHIIEFIERQYGADCVSHIATFGTLGPRQLLMDLTRVLGKNPAALRSVLAALPYDPQAKTEDLLEDQAVERGIAHYLGKDVVELMRKFSGIPRHGSVHAAGVIIDRESLVGKLPFLMPRGRPVKASQYVYEDLVELGFEKFDILGVRTLRTLKETARLTGVDLTRIPLDDEKTFRLLAAAQTIGVFQLESYGYRKFLAEFRPKDFEDVMMVNALYRPGPMQGGRGLGELIARRHGHKRVTYAHPSLEPILKNTFGIMVYQEQVMAVVQTLAGWSLATADLLRYAVGKKKHELLQELKTKFHKDCVAAGHDLEFAQAIFDDIEFFGRYGWNKAHAAAYGMVTYVSAYLKANFPAQYLCCMLNSEESDPKHRQELVAESNRMGIRVKRPHVNTSGANYSVGHDERGAFIQAGLGSVKCMGEKGVAALLDARHILGRFTSRENFRERVPARLVNSLAVRELDAVRALDGLPDTEEQIDVPF